MKQVKNISARQPLLKLSGAILMCLCLLFITGVNFIVFPQQATEKKITSATTNKADEKDPSAPVEEKSSSSNNITAQEEYIHELHSLDDFSDAEKLLHQKDLAPEKLQIVHFELISPPPDA